MSEVFLYSVWYTIHMKTEETVLFLMHALVGASKARRRELSTHEEHGIMLLSNIKKLRPDFTYDEIVEKIAKIVAIHRHSHRIGICEANECYVCMSHHKSFDEIRGVSHFACTYDHNIKLID